ncbi:MAG: NAD(P)-dependent oxidoreductase [Bacteroidia bacterium]|nr:NAD(P)-dependent oxidoreductase [Bacteroidia bacterium]
MKKKKILVFGAGGFMGTYLIDALSKLGFDITASDVSDIGHNYYKKKNIPYIHVDITKQEEFAKLPQIPFDAVVHLAATQPANVSKKNYDPKNYISVNVLGTINILEFCRKNIVGKLIYASSHRNTQGLWVNNKAITEEEGRAIKYDGEYAMFSISESAAQDCVLHYNAQYGFKGIIFRLPPVYGFGPHTEIFKEGKPIKTGFQIFIDNAKACKPIEVWGDSSKGRDIIYIKDVISAFIKGINNGNALGLYNITSGNRLTLREEAEIIAKVFWADESKPVIIEKPEKENSIDNFLYDISKAKSELDWKPEYNFENMLYDFIKESDNNSFGYLIEKRKNMLKEGI